MEERAEEEEENEREAVDHTGPEVVVGVVGGRRLAHQHKGPDERKNEAHSVRDGVEDLLEDVVSVGAEDRVVPTPRAGAAEHVNGEEAQRVAAEVERGEGGVDFERVAKRSSAGFSEGIGGKIDRKKGRVGLDGLT